MRARRYPRLDAWTFRRGFAVRVYRVGLAFTMPELDFFKWGPGS